jgi:L-alanine-DL-glutamate epimerase-like enolase superfamily enzyme
MKITAVKCAVLGDSPVVRITTDQGLDGYGQAESTKPYLKPHVLFYERYLVGHDPTDVERVMLRIRRLGAAKPWGAAVSAIEMALWDLAGKAAGLPVYKLLGGRVRDQVRVYNGGARLPRRGAEPADYAEAARWYLARPEGFTLVKEAIAFHDRAMTGMPGFGYGQLRSGPPHASRGPLTERGLDHVVACVAAMKEVLGDRVGLALDAGPGWTVPDAIRLCRRLEPYHLMWVEDLLSGDYTPYTEVSGYRDVTEATTTPTHTGEQLYLRQGFRELIEQRAVRVIGPDPADVGGLAELKWIAEHADLHGVLMAPHGVFDGLIGLAAHVNLAAALPDNLIAFEYPVPTKDWWYEIVEGLPDPIVVDGQIEVWDTPGLGVRLVPDRAKAYLSEEDAGFFD